MRPKFEKRVITLPTELSRGSAIQLLRNVPIDPIRPLSITIEEAKRPRSQDANSLMWIRIGEIAKQGWIRGRQYNTDIWHDYLKRHVLPDEVTLKDGSKASKWVESPDGVFGIVSTTQLEKTCFSEYIQAIEAWGAGELGVQFSSNRSEH